MIRPILPPAPPVRRRRIPRSFKKADVLRAMNAVREGGLVIAVVEIKADGTIRLSTASGSDQKPADDFAEWESRL